MMACGSCKYNDGCTYTSLPPRFKCTITSEFHFGNDDCNVDFEPVRRGQWKERGLMKIGYECSECGIANLIMSNYCPNCGARMEIADD